MDMSYLGHSDYFFFPISKVDLTKKKNLKIALQSIWETITEEGLQYNNSNIA